MSNATVSVASLAEVNPRTERPSNRAQEVSFIPMSDVSEAGRWVGRQTRLLSEVEVGYTAFREGDVLFAKITPCMENGKGAFVTGLKNGIGFGSTEFHVLRAIAGRCDPGFLAQISAFHEVREKAVAFFTGSAGQRRVSEKFFENYFVPHYSTDEQRRIADLLAAVDEQIALLESRITKSKLVKEGLVRDILARLADAPRRPLRNAAEVGSGVTLGRKFTGPGTRDYPYLRVANVQDGHIDLTEVKTIRLPEAAASRAMLREGDVLMNEGGDFDKLGRGAVWNGEIKGCLHQNHVFRVRCDQTVLLPEFLALWAASEFGKKFFMLASKQSTNLASINSTQLKKFPVLLPKLDDQRDALRLIGGISGALELDSREVEKLRLQKQGLAADLISGKRRVLS